MKHFATLALASTLVGPSAAYAMSPANPETPANLTVDQVKSALAAAKPDHPADFAGKSLKNLDLSGMNFTGANFEGANLFGAKLGGRQFHQGRPERRQPQPRLPNPRQLH